MIKKLFIISLLSISTSYIQAVVATGDSAAAQGTTFSFSIGPVIYNAADFITWTASSSDLSGSAITTQKYGLSYTKFVTQDNSYGNVILQAYPSLTANALVTTTASSPTPTSIPNPLLGKAYNALTLIGTQPTVCVSTEPYSIYYLQSATFSDNNAGLTNADGSSIINKLNLAPDQVINSIGGIGGLNLFIAQATGTFGTDASQLTYAQLMDNPITTTTQTTETVNGKTETKNVSTTTNYLQLTPISASSITVNTEVLTSGSSTAPMSALASIGSSVAMFPSNMNMYIGLNTQAQTVNEANTALADATAAIPNFTAIAVNDANDANIANNAAQTAATNHPENEEAQTQAAAAQVAATAAAQAATTAEACAAAVLIPASYDNLNILITNALQAAATAQAAGIAATAAGQADSPAKAATLDTANATLDTAAAVNTVANNTIIFAQTTYAVATPRAVGAFIATGLQGGVLYSSIIPNDVAQQDVNTVVSAKPGLGVAIRNITTTTTSTELSYLIVARDNGIDGVQSIYAMPMVTVPSTNVNLGCIAAFDSVEQNFTMSGKSYRTQGFSAVIADANEIDINSGDAAIIDRLLVGNGTVPLVAGQYINQLVALGDAVYITIKEAFATGATPGMFQSQALFDHQGRIMAWTPWQRVAGSDQEMSFSIKNRISDATMFVSGPTLNTIQQTTWNSSNDLAIFTSDITTAMPQPQGGIQNIIPFSPATPGLTDYQVSSVSLVAATGNENVVITQTGYYDVPTDTFQILPQSSETQVILNASNGLAIGSVVTAAFGNDFVGNNWLFMGGSNGLSVLSNDTTGAGFEFLTDVQNLLAPGQSCKTIGSFQFIKKIVSDGNYLFVMTQDAVYQILLLDTKFTATNPAPLNAVPVITATSLAPFAYCLDMLVDQGLILLGTTAGLYSINVQGGVPGVVNSIPIPMGLPSAARLQTISSSPNFNEQFYTQSNLYVLSLDFSVEQSQLNRFSIRNGVITPIEDQLLQGQNGPLVIFNYMSNNLFIDGSLGFMTSYRIANQIPSVKYLQYTLQAGSSSTHTIIQDKITNLAIKALKNSLGIAGIARDYGTGCLMLGADFGLLTDS